MESERHKETYVVDTESGSLSRIFTITDGSGTTTLCIYGQCLICEKTGDIYQYHHYNNLGSTMKLTDAKGGVTAFFTYGTYGELLSGSTGFTRFLYNGRCGVITDDNGFYYMRQRYYSLELKRFVNQDVIRGSLGNGQSLNRYSYVQGNPVSYTDPFGRSPLNGLFTGTTLWHGILGRVGCIPGPVGAIANFVDCGIYLAEGPDFIPYGKLVQEGVNPNSLIPTKDLSTLDTERMKNAVRYGGDKSIIVDNLGNVLDGHHRLKYAIENNKAVDVSIGC